MPTAPPRCATSPAGASRKPTASPPWPRELRKLGATVEEGADFIQRHAAGRHADWKAASIHTYDDHRVAMCFSLAAFNPAGLPVRILDPKCVAKTFPDYFEALFSVAHTRPGAIPVICVDGPTASGKGTLAAVLAEQLGYHFLDSGALYRITALAAMQRRPGAGRRRMKRPLPPWPQQPAGAFRGRAGAAGRRGRHRRHPHRRSRHERLPGVGPARGAHGAGGPAAQLSPAAGPGGRRPRHGHRDLPRRPAQGLPDRQRRPARRTAP